MKTILLISLLLIPSFGISQENMKCEIFKSGEKGGVKLVAKCENIKKICYVSVEGGFECKDKSTPK